MFMNPGLVISVVRGELDGGVLVDGVVSVPESERERDFC